jgi:hypothetical protein
MKTLILRQPEVVEVLKTGYVVRVRPVTSLIGFFYGGVTEFGPNDTVKYGWTFRDHWGRWKAVTHDGLLLRCPFGKPGERRLVRETWKLGQTEPGNWHKDFINGPCPGYMSTMKYRCGAEIPAPVTAHRWLSPALMRREDCQLTVEVEAVKCKRVDDVWSWFSRLKLIEDK